MATNTSKGILYPTSGDSIAPLETHFASLAQTADEAIVELETALEAVDLDLQTFKSINSPPGTGSFSFAAPTTTSTAINITVPFPVGYFSLPPIVVACFAGASDAAPCTLSVHTVTASQFQAKVVRVSGTSAQTIAVNWIAIA